jgi:hypothetical protein
VKNIKIKEALKHIIKVKAVMDELPFKATEKAFSILYDVFSGDIYSSDVEVTNVRKKDDTYIISGRFKRKGPSSYKPFTIILDKSGNFIEVKIED